jgi:putative ABC transport system permease protein
MTTFFRRLMYFFGRSRHDADLREEIEAHRTLRQDAFEREGLEPEDAAYASRRALGNIALAVDDARDIWTIRAVDSLWQDVRYAMRTLRRSPTFAAVAVLTLGLGIGATTTIYSIVDTILLQPLPFPHADRLVRVLENVPSQIPEEPPVQRGIPYSDFLEWQSRARTLTDTFAVLVNAARIATTGEGAARLWSAMVSPDTFTMLGAQAMLGRTLDAGDTSNSDVAVVSFATWQRVFHSDPDLVGKAVELGWDWGVHLPDRRMVTVVGVLPATFELPAPSFGPSTRIDIYTPFVGAVIERFPIVTLMGRLRAGVSLATARDEAHVIGSSIRPVARALNTNLPRFDVQMIQEQMVHTHRPALRIFLVAVVFVLLIVCANVANLLLARGTARREEMTIRLAIGATRGRIVRQVMTESLVLAIGGGAVGALCAAVSLALVKELASVDAPGIFQLGFASSILPRANEIGINGGMFGVAFGIAATTSLVFGILPALHLSRSHHLGITTARVVSGRRDARIRAALAVGQLVIATMLLVGAGLLMRSFVKLWTIEKGYDPRKVLVFQLVLPNDYLQTRKVDLIEALLARLRATPDVEAAGFARHGVLMPETIRIGTFVPRGRTLDEMRADSTRPSLQPVSDGYLTAMGMPVLAGRALEPTDAASSTPVVVISRTVARRYFGSASPVGQFVDWYVRNAPPVQVQVVGVVEDVRNQSPGCDACADVFIAYRQLLALQQRWGEPAGPGTTLGYMSFAVRTTGSPESMAPVVDRVVASVDPHAGVDAMIPMTRLVASSVAGPRFYAVLLGLFGVVAGLLAAIGVYGVLAYAVTQRTQEIGVRMALGARPAQVLTLVLRQGAILTTTGLALGLVGAIAGAGVLQGMLFGVTPLDPGTFIVVSLAFGLVATLASYLPARHATKVDPMVALRNV